MYTLTAYNVNTTYKAVTLVLGKLGLRIKSRVGVINVWTQKDLFDNSCDVILWSRTGFSEMVDNDNDNAWPLVVQKCWKTLFFMTQNIRKQHILLPTKIKI